MTVLHSLTNICLAALCLSICIRHSTAYRRVCYITNWSQHRKDPTQWFPEDLDASLCTHVIFAYGKVVGNTVQPVEWNDQSTSTLTGMYERLNNMKTQHPQLKTLLAIAGLNQGSRPFTAMSSSMSSRGEFAQNAVSFLRRWNFDGLDVDWEYPASTGIYFGPAEDRDRFVLLLQDLRRAFEAEATNSGNDRLILGIAGPGAKAKVDAGYDIPRIASEVDFINVMAFDYHGSWERVTGMNAPLAGRSGDTAENEFLNVEYTAEYYVRLGAPREKLNIGLALYGNSFRLASRRNNGVGAAVRQAGGPGWSTKKSGILAYFEICEMLQNGAISYWHAEHQCPYGLRGKLWFSYDNPESLALKIDFIKRGNYGGSMIWTADKDDFQNICGGGPYPLMHTISNLLNGTRPIITTPTTRLTPSYTEETTQTPQTSYSDITTQMPHSSYIDGTTQTSVSLYTDVATSTPQTLNANKTSVTSHTDGTTRTPQTTYIDGTTQRPQTTYIDGTTQTPQTTYIDGTTQTPQTTYIDGTTQTPQTAYTNGTTQTPQTTYIDRTTQMPHTTYANGTTQTLQTTYAIISTQTPQISYTGEITQTPQTTHTGGATQNLQTTYTDGTTLAPQTTNIDGTTQTPQTSYTNGTSQTPQSEYTVGTTQEPQTAYTDDTTQTIQATYTGGVTPLLQTTYIDGSSTETSYTEVTTRTPQIPTAIQISATSYIDGTTQTLQTSYTDVAVQTLQTTYMDRTTQYLQTSYTEYTTQISDTHYSNGTTSTQLPPQTTATVMTLALDDCQNRDDGVYPDSLSCAAYFLCVAGSKFELRCRDGLLFDATLHYCTDEYKVNCGSRPRSPTVITPTITIRQTPPVTTMLNPGTNSTGSQSDFCDNRPDGAYAIANDCDSFYHCSHNVALLKSCANGTAFDERIGVCNHRDQVPGC